MSVFEPLDPEVGPLDALEGYLWGSCVRCHKPGERWSFSWPAHQIPADLAPVLKETEIFLIFQICPECRVVWPLIVVRDELPTLDMTKLVRVDEAAAQGYVMRDAYFPPWAQAVLAGRVLLDPTEADPKAGATG